MIVSRSWPKLPIMCGIATLTTVASMTERKVPIITEAATSHLPADVGSLSADGPARQHSRNRICHADTFLIGSYRLPLTSARTDQGHLVSRLHLSDLVKGTLARFLKPASIASASAP